MTTTPAPATPAEELAAIQRTLANVRRDNLHWRIAFLCAVLLAGALGAYVVLDLVLIMLRAGL